jgi:hypothetical protein
VNSQAFAKVFTGRDAPPEPLIDGYRKALVEWIGEPMLSGWGLHQ